MRTLRIVLGVLVATSGLVLSGFAFRSASPQVEPVADTMVSRDITYVIEWNTTGTEFSGGALRTGSSNGYEVELTKANVRLGSFEMYACLHDDSALFSWHAQKVAAGHGSEPPNPAKISDIEPFDLLQLTPRTYAAKADHNEYCLFHQVFGQARTAGDAPVLEIEGRYRLAPTVPWKNVAIETASAYGENKRFKQTFNDHSTVTITYNLGSMLDGIEFENSIEPSAQARDILKNIIQDARVEAT